MHDMYSFDDLTLRFYDVIISVAAAAAVMSCGYIASDSAVFTAIPLLIV